MERVTLLLTLKGIQDVIILNGIEYTITNNRDDFKAVIKKGGIELIIKKNMTGSIRTNGSKRLVELFPHQLKTAHFTRYIFGKMSQNGMITEMPEFADTINIPENNLNFKNK